jgi:hypothetical protein
VRIDQNGRVQRQITVWLPIELIPLTLADRLNLIRFVLEQLEILYGAESVAESREYRDRLVAAARQVFEQQRRVATGTEADREA